MLSEYQLDRSLTPGTASAISQLSICHLAGSEDLLSSLWRIKDGEASSCGGRNRVNASTARSARPTPSHPLVFQTHALLRVAVADVLPYLTRTLRNTIYTINGLPTQPQGVRGLHEGWLTFFLDRIFDTTFLACLISRILLLSFFPPKEPARV